MRGEQVLFIDARHIYLYWGLLLIGIVAAIAEFAMDRRRRQPSQEPVAQHPELDLPATLCMLAVVPPTA